MRLSSRMRLSSSMYARRCIHSRGNFKELGRLLPARPRRRLWPSLARPLPVPPVQRLLLLPAIQLEQGEWAMAPALAHVRALEAYLVPAVVLLRNARPEWLFLARQAFAAADLDGPVSVLLDGCAHDLSPAAPPQSPGVVVGIRLGAPAPLAGRARVGLSARSGSMMLTETSIALEPLA
jgi:hypothetical protein